MNRGLRRVLIGLLATIPALGGAQEANPGVLAPYAQESRLSSPLTVRAWTLRNRIVMPPMVTVRDLAGPDGIEWYERHAAGGPGLVIVEATGIPRFTRDLPADRLRPLVTAIHRHGALAAIQLFPLDIGRNREVADLSGAEIDGIVAQYRVAARVCLEAGFDGVEPHGAHGYLLNRFFSPAHNPRTDAYGGSLANRMRLGLAIVRAIVAETGGRLLRLYRHTPVEKESYGLDESLAFARELVAAGVDILDLSPSSDPEPGDLAAPFVGLGAPVIAVGSLDDPQRAAAVFAHGRADLVAIGRGLIADPDWPRKAQAGAWDKITACTRCNKKCFGNLKQRLPIACTQWPD